MESKTQGSTWALQEPLACPRTQTRTLIIMDKRVIEDFYHITTMDECGLDETDIVIDKKFSKP